MMMISTMRPTEPATIPAIAPMPRVLPSLSGSVVDEGVGEFDTNGGNGGGCEDCSTGNMSDGVGDIDSSAIGSGFGGSDDSVGGNGSMPGTCGDTDASGPCVLSSGDGEAVPITDMLCSWTASVANCDAGTPK